MNKTAEYWQNRCEAAENLLAVMSSPKNNPSTENTSFLMFADRNDKWQRSKHSEPAASQSPAGWVRADNSPKDNGYYICWCGDEPGLIHYHVDTGWQNGFYDDVVTHWIHLTPPKI